MRNVQDPLELEIYMCDPFGVRFACLDYIMEGTYTRIANDVAPFYLKFPAPKYNWLYNRLDNIVEIVRGGRRDYIGFLRAWRYGVENGMRYTELAGVSPMELLNRRQVAKYSGEAGAELTDYADDMLKTIVYNEMGAGAAAGRNLTSVGGGFTIEQDNSLAPSISKAFSHKNVLEDLPGDSSSQRPGRYEVIFRPIFYNTQRNRRADSIPVPHLDRPSGR